ncbi:MAG: exodeoxyribonuclease III, partial [Geminicoccaceae bacterium]|nr:exodeoxyribonuclease III [Geminicoccaceae bacterium]
GDGFPAMPFEDRGYNVALVGERSGRNGVAILAKRPIDDVVSSLPGDPDDEEARYVEAFTDGIRVASVYVPNGTSVGSERFAFKLAFFERLRDHAASVLEDIDTPFVIGGDFNVAPEPIDVFDAQALDGTVCYHPDERTRFRALTHLGLYDAFRMIEPATAQVFSWWHYQGRSWKANEGMRIDHVLLSPLAADRLRACAIDRDERALKTPSDHAPVWVELA